ncbi:hypothetical protein CH54_1717 [Yersinia rochesterensis]|uniref:Uncharacterized protein n=1 Tax=Yersinia rochesterensis TaxID=1604335 RepID=A0A386HBG8_9GAMM|nr:MULTISPECIES: hypothetical protein [Yersinia]AJI86896.1 hypothetical protein AW19_4073 [Yersinia frederiksenii Y225]CNH21703.1 Uncharacterised protein [Yersinia kristensenii]AIN17983.1 hypothetical protein DJ57_2638 [Yersinia rochesterensis]AJJ34063.1 hypothetical protein CH54_1717 [Yersinia rochesterensis]AYD42996.1 hypothetical protein DXZ79_04135 [Yersinia rochesterensis]
MKCFLLMFWLVFLASPSLAQGLSGTIDLHLTIVPSCQVQLSNKNEHVVNDPKMNYPEIQCHRGNGLVTEPRISHSFIASNGLHVSKTSADQMAQLITVEW